MGLCKYFEYRYCTSVLYYKYWYVVYRYCTCTSPLERLPGQEVPPHFSTLTTFSMSIAILVQYLYCTGSTNSPKLTPTHNGYHKTTRRTNTNIFRTLRTCSREAYRTTYSYSTTTVQVSLTVQVQY